MIIGKCRKIQIKHHRHIISRLPNQNLFKDSIVLTNIGGKRTFEVRLV